MHLASLLSCTEADLIAALEGQGDNDGPEDNEGEDEMSVDSDDSSPEDNAEPSIAELLEQMKKKVA